MLWKAGHKGPRPMKLCGIISCEDFALFTSINIQLISVIHTLLLQYTVFIHSSLIRRGGCESFVIRNVKLFLCKNIKIQWIFCFAKQPQGSDVFWFLLQRPLNIYITKRRNNKDTQMQSNCNHHPTAELKYERSHTCSVRATGTSTSQSQRRF